MTALAGKSGDTGTTVFDRINGKSTASDVKLAGTPSSSAPSLQSYTATYQVHTKETVTVCCTKDRSLNVDHMYKLSFTDLISSNSYMPWAYVFDYQLSRDGLKRALEALLDRYPFLSGRLCREREAIRCSNQGVVLTYAESSYNRTDILPLIATLQAPTSGIQIDYAALPLLFEQMDVAEIAAGRAPLLQLRLTTLADGGCVLAASMAHVLVDAGRAVELLCDLAALYRGDEPPNRVTDRSLLSIDALSSLISPEEREELASHMDAFHRARIALQQENASKPPATTLTAQPETNRPAPSIGLNGPMATSGAQLMLLHIPQDDISAMKRLVMDSKRVIAEGARVSTASVVTALLWMLLLDMKHDGAPPVDGRSTLHFTASMISKSLARMGLIPSNYLGNTILMGAAAVALRDIVESFLVDSTAGAEVGRGDDAQYKRVSLTTATLDDDGDVIRDDKGDIIIGGFVSVACAVVDAVRLLRQDHMHEAHSLLRLKMMIDDMAAFFKVRPQLYPDKIAVKRDNCGIITARNNFPVMDVDFGQGGPSLMSGLLVPSFIGWCGICPGLGLGGVVVHMQVPQDKVQRLLCSKFLRVCAPGAKFIR